MVENLQPKLSRNCRACFPTVVLSMPTHHPHSQGSLEHCHRDVENMLRSRVDDNKSKNWGILNLFDGRKILQNVVL